MNANRNFRVWALTAVLALGIAFSTAGAATLQQVRNNGMLRVGIVLAAPWAMRNGDGDLTGFEIDVARRLAADLEVDVEFIVYRFEELVTALETGEIDIVAAGLAITPERALHVNFSDPYAVGGIGLATNLAVTESVSRLEELSDPDFALAVVEGSVAGELAARILPDARVVAFANADAAADALVEGEVAALLDEEPVPTYLALENPSIVDLPIARPLLETRSGFAVAKGDADFVFFLNAWIAAHEADTWLPTTHQYWFESLAWQAR